MKHRREKIWFFFKSRGTFVSLCVLLLWLLPLLLFKVNYFPLHIANVNRGSSSYSNLSIWFPSNASEMSGLEQPAVEHLAFNCQLSVWKVTGKSLTAKLSVCARTGNSWLHIRVDLRLLICVNPKPTDARCGIKMDLLITSFSLHSWGKRFPFFLSFTGNVNVILVYTGQQVARTSQHDTVLDREPWHVKI